MNSLKSTTKLTIFTLFLFTCVCFSQAQYVWHTWNQSKEEVFRLAKEQDKFILLFVGRPTCSISQRISTYFTDKAGALKPIIEDNFIPWYSYHDDMDRKIEVKDYTAEILLVATSLPLISIINPDNPGKNVITQWGNRSVDIWKQFFTINLLAESSLKWYKNEAEVFRLAREQGKYVFKLTGKGTSPNCQKVIKQLNANPFRDILAENYILWYSEDLRIGTYSGVEKSLPNISVIYPETPDIIMEEAWGYKEDEVLDNLLRPYTVSNEISSSPNIVTVSGNLLSVSNQTADEHIKIFTINGRQVASVRKNDGSVKIDASCFPKGLLIISGSTGWSKKILFQ